MNAAIYSRKSKISQKGDSIENQIQLCKEYLKIHFPDIKKEDIIVYEDDAVIISLKP